MERSEGFLIGTRGLRIHWRRWLPDKGQPRAIVVVVHGLGEHSGRYDHVAATLVASGYAVYAIDHRGHGQSEGTRVLLDRFSYAVDDIDRLVELARRAYPRKPLYLLGHSLGGALSLSYGLKHADKLAGLMLSGPAISLEGAPPLMKPLARILSMFLPRLGLFRIDPSAVSRDPTAVADYAADPLNAHGKVPARTLGELVNFVEWLPAVLPLIQLPLLLMHGGDDKLAGVAGSRLIAERAGSRDKTLKIYDGFYHEIFNELPPDRARVLDDLIHWLNQHVSTAR